MPYEEGSFRQRMEKRGYALAEKISVPLVKAGISPNHITVVGMLLSFVSGMLFATGSIFPGGLFLWLSAAMDPIDGTVARLSGKASRFGALLDSTLDRYSEFFVFFGLLIYFNSGWMFITVMLALMGSIMVSYVKARAEGLGQKEFRGLMQRPERIMLLLTGAILNTPINSVFFPGCPDCTMKWTLVILAVLTNFTALQRLVTSRRELA